LLNRARKALLVRMLDGAETLAELRIVCRPLESLEILEIVLPRGAELLREELREPRIRLLEPTAHRDAVRHVREAIGPHVGEVLEDRLSHQPRVKLRDAVHLVATDDRQISHPYAPIAFFIDERHTSTPIEIVRVLGADRFEEVAIDLID